MVHNEYSWKTYDRISLYGQSWMPHDRPRAIINYVHGFKDHSGRFQHWAMRLVENGYGVMAIDLRGHGRSSGRRGAAAGFGSYLKDVLLLRQKAQELYDDVPHVLYGHSLGGSIVVNYLISQNYMPHAAVITSPWFTLTTRPSLFLMAFAQVARYALPGLLVRSELDPSYLSRDPNIAKEYESDPLVHNSILPALYFDIEAHGLKASRSIYKINIPLLVMHGTDDQITSYKQTCSFVMNAGVRTTFKDWPGGYHELQNDICEKEVFSFLLQWLSRNC
jgi:acylglycerol lipase